MKTRKTKFIFSAGGTGGHIYPALATADALRKLMPNAEIMFVGAENRMEMDKVPHHGYPIIGLPIQGIKRKLSLQNLLVPFKILKSLAKARKILKDFKPSVVVGFGGYASGPVMRKAMRMGIKTLLQEQNSYPGLTNRLLAKKVDLICVAYPNMETFFDSSKIVITGNPIRKEISQNNFTKADACKFFNLNPDKVTILAVGGSLGARTINESICNLLPEICKKDYQLIWQTGRYYEYHKCINYSLNMSNNVFTQEFIYEMPQAYAAADIIISRSGAIAVSEISAIGKPVIFIPSPNVTDDHQTKNAMTLVNADAALIVKDEEAREKLGKVLFDLILDTDLQKNLSQNIKKMAKPDAAEDIAKKIIELM